MRSLHRFILSPLCAAAGAALCASAAQAQTDAQPQQVTVTAAAPKQALAGAASGGALGDRSILDTPFSVTSVDAEGLQDRQVYSLGQAFARTPGVSSESSSYTIYSTDLVVRGLELDYANGYKLDGLPIYAVGFDVPYEHLERVDLLEGLSGFMYGFGAPGGIVNFVTKKAGPQPVTHVDIGYRSNSVLTEHLDIGRRFGDAGRYGARLNVTHEEGDTYNDGRVRRDAQSLALDARLTDDLSLSLDGMHQTRHTSGEVSVLALFSYESTVLPAPVSGRAHLASPGTYNDTRLDYAGAGLHWRLSDDWKLDLRLGQSVVTAAFVKDFSMLTDASGDYDASLLADRNTARYAVAQAMLQGHVATGPVDHQIVAGLERQSFVFGADTGGFYEDNGTGNLYRDNPNVYDPQPIAWGMQKSNDDRQAAVFASDTLSFGANWSAIAGARVTDYRQRDYGAAPTSYEKDGVATPTLALMFKPGAGTTVYGSYVESLEPGTIVGDQYVNHGVQLAPLKSRQVELGLKAQRADWSATAALFRIRRGAEYGNEENVYVQNGLSTYRGLEANATVRPIAPLTLGGGLLWMRSTYGRGTDFDGNRIPSAPGVVIDAWADVDVPQVPGLRLHAGGKFTGATAAVDSDALTVASHGTFDAGAAWTMPVGARSLVWRLQVNNLFDRKYWVSSASSQIVPGLPRTVSASVALDL